MQRTLSGLRIRERRRDLGIKQIDLAARVGVSAPYLNLIERNKRTINGALLARIGAELDMTLDQLDGTAERRLRERLQDAIADAPTARGKALNDQLDELVTRFPDWARTILSLHSRMEDATAAEDAMADRLTHDPALGSAVHNMLTEITALRSTSEILTEGGAMPEAQRHRFETIMFEQSSRLATTGASLADYFDNTAQARRRRTPHIRAEEALTAVEDIGRRIEDIADTIRRQLEKTQQGGGADLVALMEAALPHPVDLPDEAGFLERRDAMALIIAAAQKTSFDPILTIAFKEEPQALTPDVRAQAERELSRRIADALILPAWRILSLGKKHGWDVEVLTRAADGDTALALRRVAVLYDLGGPRAAHLTVDASGRILSRRGTLDLTPPSRVIDCPVWPVHRAPPDTVSVTPIRLSEDVRALALAKASDGGMRADMLLLDTTSASASVYAAASQGRPALVGTECRICPWKDCQWRREAAVVG